jgi:hypothetical protein
MPDPKDLLARIAALEPEARRIAFARHCAGDSRLQAEVEALALAAEAKPHRFLEAQGAASAPALPLSVIGQYRILRGLGRGGGQAVVDLAEDRTLGREVALKM